MPTGSEICRYPSRRASTSSATSRIALGALWAVVTGTWYLLFTWAVNRGRALVARPAVQRRLQLATGGVLILLGAAVAAGA